MSLEAEYDYDGGWDRRDDDDGAANWYLQLENERNPHHPGRYRDGRFTGDLASILDPGRSEARADEVMPTRRPIAPVASRSAPKGPTPSPTANPQRPRTEKLPREVEQNLRYGLSIESKKLGVKKQELWTERVRRYRAGEGIERIVAHAKVIVQAKEATEQKGHSRRGKLARPVARSKSALVSLSRAVYTSPSKPLRMCAACDRPEIACGC